MSRRPKPTPPGNPHPGNDAATSDGGNSVNKDGTGGAENSGGKLADATAGWTATDTIANATDTRADTIANAFTEPVSAFADAGTADTGTVSTADTAARKRGRPRGSTNKSAPADITGIEKLLLSCHTMLAASIPEMAMDAAEAHQIAVAYNDVANYYPIMRLPGNVSALVTFAGVIGVSYGSRLMAIRFRVMAQGPRPQRQRQAAPSPPQPNSSVQMSANEMPMPPPEQEINGVDYGAAGARPNVPQELRQATIPGVGIIEFPPDHELIRGKGH